MAVIPGGCRPDTTKNITKPQTSSHQSDAYATRAQKSKSSQKKRAQNTIVRFALIKTVSGLARGAATLLTYSTKIKVIQTQCCSVPTLIPPKCLQGSSNGDIYKKRFRHGTSRGRMAFTTKYPNFIFFRISLFF